MYYRLFNLLLRPLVAFLLMLGWAVAPVMVSDSGGKAATAESCCIPMHQDGDAGHCCCKPVTETGEPGCPADVPGRGECGSKCGDCVPTAKLALRIVAPASAPESPGMIPQLNQQAVASHVTWRLSLVELDSLFHPPRA